MGEPQSHSMYRFRAFGSVRAGVDPCVSTAAAPSVVGHPTIVRASAVAFAGVCVMACARGEPAAPFFKVERRRINSDQRPRMLCLRMTISSSFSWHRSVRRTASRWAPVGERACRTPGSQRQTDRCITGEATNGLLPKETARANSNTFSSRRIRRRHERRRSPRRICRRA